MYVYKILHYGLRNTAIGGENTYLLPEYTHSEHTIQHDVYTIYLYYNSSYCLFIHSRKHTCCIVSCLLIAATKELVLNCFYMELSHTHVHYHTKLPNRGLSRNVVSVSWLKILYTKNVSTGSIGILGELYLSHRHYSLMYLTVFSVTPLNLRRGRAHSCYT